LAARLAIEQTRQQQAQQGYACRQQFQDAGALPDLFQMYFVVRGEGHQ